jgi:hypothetical protein
LKPNDKLTRIFELIRQLASDESGAENHGVNCENRFEQIEKEMSVMHSEILMLKKKSVFEVSSQAAAGQSQTSEAADQFAHQYWSAEQKIR